jgi:hypothetical protein
MDLFERVRLFFAVGVCTAALAACGGGGGGGGGSVTPPGGGGGGGATPTPTPATSTASVTTSTTSSQTGTFGPVAGGYSGSVTIPAASVATTVNATLTTTQPSGPPAPSALRRRPQNIGASPISAIAYVTVTSPVTVTFPQAPSFTVTLPFAVTQAIGSTSYVAFYDSSKPQNGWTTIEGSATASGTTLSFNGTFGGAIAPLTLTANQPAYFVLFTVSSALPTPTPTPTSTPASGAYVAPTGGVTQLGPNATNVFSSSLLAASTDGTLVVQSMDAPPEPTGAASPLTEYDVAVSESAAGQKPSSLGNRFAAAIVALRGDGAASAPYRVRRDFRQSALNQTNRRTMSALRITRANAQSAQSLKRRTSSFTAGATHTFHVYQGTITGTGGTCVTPQIKIGTDCYVDVIAQLQAISNHAYVWVDNLIDATYNFSNADFQATATAFDVDYARETAAFGPAFFNAGGNYYEQCDANGVRNTNTNTYTPAVDLSGVADPHVSMLITKALENTGEGGYFSAGDLLNDQELNCAYQTSAHMPSNQLPMFIMSADKYPTTADEPYWRAEDMPRTLPHEFQHYLHAINKVFAPNLRDGNSTVVFDDSFVDEGDSMLAEDLVNSNNSQSNDTLLASFFYLYNPANYSFTAWVGYDANPLDTSTNPAYGFYRSTEGNYGQGYLFARYMYDRFGGDAALHRVYASLTPTAGTGANVAPIVAEANNGETFAQLYADFAAALAARNVASTDPRFSLNSTVFLVGSKTLPVPGGTYDIVMNGPRSPDDLTSAHPAGRVKLTPSNAANAKLMTGATLFFNAAASAGSIVSLDATTAPSGKVAGALVQGGYNDSGSCLGTVALNGC